MSGLDCRRGHVDGRPGDLVDRGSRLTTEVSTQPISRLMRSWTPVQVASSSGTASSRRIRSPACKASRTTSTADLVCS